MYRQNNRGRLIESVRQYFGYDPETTDVSAVSHRIYEGVVSSGIELAGQGPRHILGDLVVEIHPADHAALVPFQAALEHSIAQLLSRDASRRNLTVIGALQLRYEPDGEVRRGRPVVRAAGSRTSGSSLPHLFDAVDVDAWGEDPTQQLGDPTQRMADSATGAGGCLVPVQGSGDIIDRSGTIGRGPHVDLFVESNKLSKVHARVDFAGGECRVRDLGSMNGTYVENDRLLPETTAILTTDQIVRFADREFVYLLPVGRA